MALPVFFAVPTYVSTIRGKTMPLARLCVEAGVECQGVGRWIERPVIVNQAVSGELPSIQSEPNDYGVVAITVPHDCASALLGARWALGAMAYVLFDRVARASIAGAPWARAAVPPGRHPGPRRALSNKERQRRFNRTR